MQLPNLSKTTLGIFSQDNIINRDLPSLWLLYNHKIWTSVRSNDSNLNTWQMLPLREAGIYQIECKQTGKKYIGETKNIRQRFRNTYNALQQGTHPSNSLQVDWNNFRPQNFIFTILYLDSRLSVKSICKEVENFFVYENRTNSYNDTSKYGMNNLQSIEETRLLMQ